MDVAPLSTHTVPPGRQQEIMAKAKDLEAVFLAEMLTYAGMGDSQGSFSGAEGEAQFASFLRQEQAKAIVEGGGVGLAQSIFTSMLRAEGGSDANGA
ncbi:MAG: hypothetical protein B7Z10_08850 [Rhodobacterales bacterium 32-66-7]|nr:MAG: hypothetical protein B7Z31_05350 [Rhodobacterales bacterium 12-65-15]OYX24604.1 MAG: hypothetical protein B7Z10_08850 [Rhodobacterales bacterium 32-66-7]